MVNTGSLKILWRMQSGGVPVEILRKIYGGLSIGI